MAVISGTVALNSSTPVKVCTMGEQGALVWSSATANTVFIGGPNVAATGANQGIGLPASAYVSVPGARAQMSMSVPAGADNTADLYAIASTGTPSISYLAPQGG